MNRIVLLATAASLALTGMAVAQTSPSTTVPAQSPPAASSNAGTPATTPAAPSATMATPPATPAQPTGAENEAQPSPTSPTQSAAAPTTAPATVAAGMKHHGKKSMKAARAARAKRHAARHPTMVNARIERRETKALNLLQAQGYGSYDDFRREGGNYSAMVMVNGAPQKVLIDPDSGTVTPQR